MKCRVSPGARGASMRTGSPSSDSILITWAPPSARSCAQYGTAMNWPNSTTSTPANGRGSWASGWGMGDILPATGCALGPATGCALGPATGCALGPATGCALGPATGCALGPATGCALGPATGWALGPATGWALGPATGWALGPATGWALGPWCIVGGIGDPPDERLPCVL